MNKIILLSLLCSIYSSSYSQNKALLLNGVDDYVEMSDHNDLDFIDQMSIEAWIKPMTEVSVGDQVILGKQWCYGADFAYYFGVFDNKLRFVWNTSGNCNSSSSFETDSQVIGAGQCYHVAVVFSSTAIQFYVDGNPVTGAVVLGSYGAINNSESPLRVGCYRNFSGIMTNFFYGELDEIRVWDYQLSQININDRLNISLNGNDPGLVAYYDMEVVGSGSGLTVENSAISTGSLLNGVTYGTASTPEFVNSCFSYASAEVKDNTTQFDIYPNPSNGIFLIENVNSNGLNSIDVLVFDAFGQQVMIALVENGVLDLSSLTKGVYFLLLSSDQGAIHKKVVIN
ncbi:MAG: hypothetical protein ACJAUD_000169 [Crocinitomicaceae bacterium]|jgi:hypothetical protein